MKVMEEMVLVADITTARRPGRFLIIFTLFPSSAILPLLSK